MRWIRDDRGHRAVLREHRFQPEDLGAVSRRKRAGRAYVATLLWSTFGLLIVLVSACLAGYLIAQGIAIWLPRSVWTSHVLPAALIAVAGLGSVYYVWIPVAQRLTLSVHLWQGCCGTCGYCLHGLAPEADGCVVCPECDAAWRLDPKPDA